MASATLHIRALDVARGVFPLELIENGVVTAADELSVAQLQSGEWTVVLNAQTDPPDVIQRDIVNLVAGMSGAVRSSYPRWRELGNHIADWLLPPKIRQRLLAVPNSTLSLNIEPKLLAPVPWELGRFGPPERRLATNFALTRLHGKPAPAGIQSSWPFRILIVVGCSEADEDDQALAVRREVSRIDRAFLPLGRSVDVEVIRRPSRKELREKIKESHPHVLHFAGHAGPNPNKEPGLRFDLPANGASWVWSVSDMQSDLGPLGWVPHCVFLNACRTAQEQSGAWSMQGSFADVGTHAILTMQADVRGDLAGVFAESLYKKLIDKMTLQDAMLEARQALMDELGGGAEIDWALPLLTATDPAMQLFQPAPRPADKAFDVCEEFEQAKFYANCRDGRRLLTRWVCPARVQAAGSAPSNVLILTGAPLSGKSHLLKWSMETWAVAGAQVRYVQLCEGINNDLLGALRQIRDGRPGLTAGNRYLGQGLPSAAFDRFNWELNNILRTGHIGEWDEAKYDGQRIKDSGGPLVARGEDCPAPTICNSFHGALRKVADKDPLILVIDGLSKPTGERVLGSGDFIQLIDHLFVPIATDAQSRIKLVLVANHDEMKYYELTRLGNGLSSVYPLADNIDDQELIQHAIEMFWYEGEDKVKQLASLLLSLKRMPPLYNGLGRLSEVLATLQNTDLAQRVKRMI